MKTWARLVIAASVLSAPFASFAQSNVSVSRADVHRELVRAQNAGYEPRAEEATYPANVQMADARIAQERAAQIQATSYGGSTGAGAQSGAVVKRVGPQDAFFGQ